MVFNNKAYDELNDIPEHLADFYSVKNIRSPLDESRAEIERLEREVERLKSDLGWMTADRGKWQDSATRRYYELNTAWNDAIDAAAITLQSESGTIEEADYKAYLAHEIRALKRSQP